jgi:hypothetical protein
MPDARTPWPSPPVERQLTDALLRRTPVSTPYDITRAFLAPLTAYLRNTHPNIDPNACATAAVNAILDVCQHPTPYDPSGLPLGAFLRFVAERDLRTADRDEPRPVVAVAVRG